MTQSIQYMVKDLQGNLYGPADIPTLRAWIAEGRLAPNMNVAPVNSSNWVPLGTLAELAAAFASTSATSRAPASPYGASPAASPSPYSPVSPASPAGYTHAYATPYGNAPGTNGMAIASLVCSLVAVLSLTTLALCCPMAFVPGGLGLVFGLIARHQIRTSGQDGQGLALAGIIVSVISLVLTLLAMILFAVFFAIGAMNSH